MKGYAYAAVAVVALAACSPFRTTTQSTVVVEGTDSITVAHAPLHNSGAWSLGGAPSLRDVEGENPVVPLENKAKLSLISLSAPGCFSAHYIVQADRYNTWKFADLTGMATGIAMMARGESTESPEAFIGGGFFLAFGNFVAWLFPPKRVFAPEYAFDPLEGMPTAPEGFVPFELVAVDFNLPAGAHAWTYYEELKDLERGRWVGRNSSRDDVVLEDTNLDRELRALLVDQGFQTEPSASLLRAEGSWALRGELVGLKEERLARAVRYFARTKWWLEHPYGLPVDTLEVETPSTWHVYSTGDLGFNREALVDAMGRAVLMAAEAPALLQDAVELEAADSIWSAQWEPIALHPLETVPGKVAKAVESIVTIEDEHGHGSGCILDPSGWILTNHHVANDTATVYKVTLQDGTTYDGRMVRHHPVWDLALIKVDAEGLIPFAVEEHELPELGEDVFAIGTPYDTGLGATLTRGIVSGKRKDGLRTLIQTDVSISPGNSGGALARPDGALVGIITEKVMDAGVEGIGFAMPVNELGRLLGVEMH